MKVIKEWIGVLLMLCLSIGLWPVQAKAAAYTIYWPLSTSYKITNSFSNHPSKMVWIWQHLGICRKYMR